MAYIKIDHTQFRNASNAVDTYIRNHKKSMNSIEQEMTSLGASWKGEDYLQIKHEWNQIHDSGSTSDKMLISLQNYADALEATAKKYKDAQSRAVNRANTLCK